ncbi:MAG: RNA-binding domain-containing protein [Thermoplasmatota archaeon]
MRVRVTGPVRPTESVERVQQAALRFLPDATVDVGPEAVVAKGTSLETLRRRIWELRIIDAMRGRLLAGLQADGQSVRFALGKQAALAGTLALPIRPHALGDLEWEVTVEPGDPWRDAEALVWWLCPETKDGEIVGPLALPATHRDGLGA